jgi:hypothetical protein
MFIEATCLGPCFISYLFSISPVYFWNTEVVIDLILLDNNTHSFRPPPPHLFCDNFDHNLLKLHVKYVCITIVWTEWEEVLIIGMLFNYCISWRIVIVPPPQFRVRIFCYIIIPPLPEGGVYCFTSVRLSVLPSVQDIFRRIFLSNCRWQKSDIWSQASYRYTILWVAFLYPSDSYFLFAEERGYHKWALAHSSSCLYLDKLINSSLFNPYMWWLQ